MNYLQLILKLIIIVLAIVIVMKILKHNKIIENFHYLPYHVDNKTALSSYDGVNLKSKQNSMHKWRTKPSNQKLRTDKAIRTHQGLSNSINLVGHDGPIMDTSAPPVNGLKEQSETMNSKFLFRLNEVSPECCPSTYTTYRVCVCTTDHQREFIARRGNLLN